MDGMRSFVSKGTSILETSQQAGITHEHVCGGRERCTTCKLEFFQIWINYRNPIK